MADIEICMSTGPMIIHRRLPGYDRALCGLPVDITIGTIEAFHRGARSCPTCKEFSIPFIYGLTAEDLKPMILRQPIRFEIPPYNMRVEEIMTKWMYRR